MRSFSLGKFMNARNILSSSRANKQISGVQSFRHSVDEVANASHVGIAFKGQCPKIQAECLAVMPFNVLEP